MNFKDLSTAITNFNDATQATDAEITSAISAKLKEIKDAQAARAKVITKLAVSMSLTEDEVESTFGGTLTPKVDVVAAEASLRAAAKEELDKKKEINFYATLEKISKLDAAVSAIEHERELEKLQLQASITANQSSIDKLYDMMMAKEFMNMNAPTPAPTPAPAPTTTVTAPTPAPIATRKELGNKLRSISAAATADRAEIHADSVNHPFTGNYKAWGSSIFQELADRARARSEYWSNK